MVARALAAVLRAEAWYASQKPGKACACSKEACESVQGVARTMFGTCAAAVLQGPPHGARLRQQRMRSGFVWVACAQCYARWWGVVCVHWERCSPLVVA